MLVESCAPGPLRQSRQPHLFTFIQLLWIHVVFFLGQFHWKEAPRRQCGLVCRATRVGSAFQHFRALVCQSTDISGKLLQSPTSLGLQSPSEKVGLGWVWRVQTPEEVLGALGLGEFVPVPGVYSHMC